MMKRIGLLGIEEQTENMLIELFKLDPDAQVFLSDDNREKANQLAVKFPCWIQDNDQAVVDEADIVLVDSESIRLSKKQSLIKYRSSQLVIFLDSWPSFNTKVISPLTEEKVSFINRHIALQNVSPFSHLTGENIDNYLYIVRALLKAINPTFSLELNFQTSTETQPHK